MSFIVLFFCFFDIERFSAWAAFECIFSLLKQFERRHLISMCHVYLYTDVCQMNFGLITRNPVCTYTYPCAKQIKREEGEGTFCPAGKPQNRCAKRIPFK